LQKLFLLPVQKHPFPAYRVRGEIPRPRFNIGRQKNYSKPFLLSKGKVKGVLPPYKKRAG